MHGHTNIYIKKKSVSCLPLVTFIQGIAVDDTENCSCSVTSEGFFGMVEPRLVNSGTVDVLVSVALSFVTVIVDKFTGFLIDWVTLGYI